MDNPIVRIERSDIKYFTVVDDVISRSVAAGDPLIALEYIQGLQRDGFVRGLAIAKMLYRMKQSWDLFRAAGIEDDFENVVETTTGYKPATTSKYINMWESIFENPAIPEDIQLELAGKPIETLLLLTAAAREGSLDDDDWQHVAHSSDKEDVRQRIREKRGHQTSSRTARTLTLYRKDRGDKAAGTLTVSVDGEQKLVGFLKLDTGDVDVEQMIERLVNAVHIYEVF